MQDKTAELLKIATGGNSMFICDQRTQLKRTKNTEMISNITIQTHIIKAIPYRTLVSIRQTNGKNYKIYQE